MESQSQRQPSRIAAARARSATAKQVLLTSALALFFAVMLLARLTHPAHASQSTSASSSTTSSANDFYGSSNDDFQSGSIAPTQSAPQVATGSS
jgi:hypothetical protein